MPRTFTERGGGRREGALWERGGFRSRWPSLSRGRPPGPGLSIQPRRPGWRPPASPSSSALGPAGASQPASLECAARCGLEARGLFPGDIMPNVKVRENEPFEFALRRFKRTCEKAGVLAETRKREFYEKPTQERKRKAAAAVKRHLRRMSRDVTKRQRLY